KIKELLYMTTGLSLSRKKASQQKRVNVHLRISLQPSPLGKRLNLSVISIHFRIALETAPLESLAT
ncbi:hypothetical protein, partial [Staphylococcus croceilyticus]|uniref:hypothetical protein n=1 Tax=Staphylococcus croceilyticus TaxID=319942 RepID=UPI001E3DBB71